MQNIPTQGNDEARRRAAKAEADRRIAAGEFTTQEQVDQFMASKGISKRTQEQPPASAADVPYTPTKAAAEEMDRPPMGAARAIGTALASGIPFIPGVAGTVRAAINREPGETFSQARARGMRDVGALETQAKEELAPGIGTLLQLGSGLASGTLLSRAPLLRASVPKDAGALAKLGAATKRVAGGAGLAAAEAASRQGMYEGDLGPTGAGLLATGIGTVLEGTGPLVRTGARMVGRLPVVGAGIVQAARTLAEPVQEAVTQARRGTTEAIRDYFVPRFGQTAERVASAIEPTDAIRIQRTVSQALPTTGQTVAQMEQQALRATESAKGLESALKTAEEAAAESAARTTARGKALVQRAEQRAESVVQELEREAETQFGQLAATQGRGAAMREAIKSRMEQLGKQVYGAVQQVPPLAEPPRRIYQQIDKNNSLSSAFEFAQSTKQQRRLGERVEQAMEAGVPITERVKTPRQMNYVLGQARNPATGELVDIKRPVLDLETFDYMKRWVSDRVEAGLSGDVSGISRSQAAGLLKQIKRMEDDFLNAHDPAARKTLETARSTMAKEFDRLELVKDGLNLTRFSLNAPAEMRGASERDLAELITRVGSLSPKERKLFEIPARQAIANLIQTNDQSLESVATALVGNTQARKRAALALGQETVTELQKFLPERIKGAGELAAGPIRRVGEQLVERGAAGGGMRTQRLATEAASLAEQLQGQRTRAGQLGATAEAAKEGIAALTDYTAGRGFAATLPGRGLGGVGQREVGGAMAGVIQDQIRGLNPQEALAKLRVLQQNPATQAMFGNALDQAIEQLRPKAGRVAPIRAALTGQMAGRM